MTFLDKIKNAVSQELQSNALQLSTQSMGFLKNENGNFSYCLPNSLGGNSTPIDDIEKFVEKLSTLGCVTKGVFASFENESHDAAEHNKHLQLQSETTISHQLISQLVKLESIETSPRIKETSSFKF